VYLPLLGINQNKSGEIDIIEGIHDQPTNQYTLHSGPNCNLTTSNTEVRGRIGNRQCATINGVNTGCYFSDDDTRSYGKGFNLIAGGVFAHLWDHDGIKMWHFPRTEIPEDITAGNPDPSRWPAPVAFWDSAECDMADHFHDHTLVLDITLCGDWAGGSSYQSAGCAGTCKEAVRDPTNYNCVFLLSISSDHTYRIHASCKMEDKLHSCLQVAALDQKE
jgi:hypothetical protein